jgi:hypothetical protein
METTISPEARAKYLKETIDGAIERLAEQLAEGHTSDYLKLLTFWSRFHRYSHGNALLIFAQRPDATQVAGYRTWKRQGRQVKSGARAIIIWCPILRTIEDEDTGLPVEVVVGFNPCPVFAAEDLTDIATNPLPTLWKRLPDDAEALYRHLKTKVEEHGLRVEEIALPPSKQGMTSPSGMIILAAGLDSRNRIMVLLHEVAHAIEHYRPEREGASREQKELEAESASAVICAILGIEHPTARDYILMYAGTAEDLKASLAAIRRMVGRMVNLLGLTKSADESAAALAA